MTEKPSIIKKKNKKTQFLKLYRYSWKQNSPQYSNSGPADQYIKATTVVQQRSTTTIGDKTVPLWV